MAVYTTALSEAEEHARLLDRLKEATFVQGVAREEDPLFLEPLRRARTILTGGELSHPLSGLEKVHDRIFDLIVLPPPPGPGPGPSPGPGPAPPPEEEPALSLRVTSPADLLGLPVQLSQLLSEHAGKVLEVQVRVVAASEEGDG